MPKFDGSQGDAFAGVRCDDVFGSPADNREQRPCTDGVQVGRSWAEPDEFLGRKVNLVYWFETVSADVEVHGSNHHVEGAVGVAVANC